MWPVQKLRPILCVTPQQMFGVRCRFITQPEEPSAKPGRVKTTRKPQKINQTIQKCDPEFINATGKQKVIPGEDKTRLNKAKQGKTRLRTAG